ncbi:MAG: recombinase family protein [Hyphomicrobiaceae bacterium TMED74]|nr:hypothetical protein [Filomicrobium sp.]RPG48593.1 MAG: recombinase family protein [Hyphomicrobiaceae bacterium TMED74]
MLSDHDGTMTCIVHSVSAVCLSQLAAARLLLLLLASAELDSTRLSRSLIHLLSFINDLNEADKKIYIAQSNLDTSTPAGKMMVSVLGAFGEYERGMISERIKAGLKRTRTEGTRLGRPRLAMDQDTRQTIHDIYTAGHTIAHIVRTTGITRRRIDVELGRA